MHNLLRGPQKIELDEIFRGLSDKCIMFLRALNLEVNYGIQSVSPTALANKPSPPYCVRGDLGG